MTNLPTHLVLIDGSNMMHRAFAMARPEQRSADGQEVGGAVLFSQMLAKLLDRMQAGRVPGSHAAIFFDPSREQSWRREVFPDYKAHRPEMEEVLRAQIPWVHAAARALRLGFALDARFEADDLIAAYCEDGVKVGARVTIVTGDKDLMQLVRPGVMQYSPVQDKWFNPDAVEAKFGVPPVLLGDFLAMAGDASDGIPGAPGIGPKTAAALLNEFGSLSAVLSRSSEIKAASRRKKIEENRENLRMSRLLVALDAAGAPRPIGWEGMRLGRMSYRGAAADWRRTELL